MRYTILCYGDSNTYGYVPAGGGKRYDEDIRWPCRLQKLLGNDYYVIEEGCSGRTTDVDDPEAPWKNGMSGLLISLHTHKPIDLIILMLGTNDLKTVFHRDAETIAAAAASIGNKALSYLSIKQESFPQILFLCPPHLYEHVENGVFGGEFSRESYLVSLQLPEYYRKQADQNGFIFMDTSRVLKPSETDGVHLTPESHAVLADELSALIKARRFL
ncbi:MAG: SGNH/GDSL hydrolase family protein [Solobacterium sp.]|nr:SGNH/GDSL hydrolase family protein [Solobacterium sp.]